ncbi:MAG: DegV family protein [Anaerolineae bacterium]|nr:DegV family protein [Anaerolineae bacterium]
MTKIAIATDSTANLPPELVAQYDISIIPLNVHWGEETYLDGETIDVPMFYRWLEERKDFPMTSQPAVGAFMEFFKEVAEKQNTDTILGIFLSSPLSGTLASAMQARGLLPDLDIELVDSRFVSMALGFQVLTAARMASENAPMETILYQVHQVRAHTELMLAVDTLEYLHRGGRIGGGARFLGTALNLKPVLIFESGKIEALAKVRSRRKSLERMVTEAKTRLANRRPKEFAVMHTPNDDDVEFMVELVTAELRPQRLYSGMITPVLGTHAGPGVIGIGYYTE